MKTEQRDQ